jgi:hypothetical protein
MADKNGAEIVSGLNNEYINVKLSDVIKTRSYGGNQKFFKPLEGTANEYKYRYGCGLVALADTILYMSTAIKGSMKVKGTKYTSDLASMEEYRDYFDGIVSMTGWVPTPIGATNAWLVFAFNLMAVRRLRGYVGFWGLSRRKIFGRVNRMLSENIPVILCIPNVINIFRRKKYKLKLYVPDTDCRHYEQVNTHFVTVTGIVQRGERIFYRVSSWGMEYEIDIREYDQMLKGLLFGNILGNVLVIRKVLPL